jgi:putative transposase
MARLKRLIVPGAAHYLSQRVVAGGSAFVDVADRQAFMAALRSCSTAQRVAVVAYALLEQQVQLVVVPEQAGALAPLMQALTRQYVGPFNRKHGRSGALWQSRFTSAPVEAGAYLMGCVVYVEQAPVRAGLQLAATEHAWSSARYHAGLASGSGQIGTDGWLAPMPAGSAYWALGNTPFEREAAYRRRLEQPLTASEIEKIEATVGKGWALGSAGFVAEVGALSGRRSAPAPRGRPALVRV